MTNRKTPMQPLPRSNVRRLVIAVAALATLGAASIAEASPATLSGWGQRGGARFMGSITQQADSSLHGQLWIVVDAGNNQPTVVAQSKK